MTLLRGQNIKPGQTLPVRSSSHLQTHMPTGNTEGGLMWMEGGKCSQPHFHHDTGHPVVTKAPIPPCDYGVSHSHSDQGNNRYAT